VSNQAVCQVGVDVYFLSEPGRGVYRISEAVQEQIAVNPLAVSDPIQPIIDKIDWVKAAQWATIRALGPYIYIAVPLLGSSVAANNTVLVYNQFTKLWESIDTFGDTSLGINQFHVIATGAGGTNRQLLGVDWARNRIYGMYFGTNLYDNFGGSLYWINDLIETRGYTLGDPVAFKRFQRTCISLQTFNPQFVLSSISDGYNEVKQLHDVSNITKDKLRFYVHGLGRWSNPPYAPTIPEREDYRVTDSDTTIGTLQNALERFQVRQNGRYASIRIANAGGVCNVTAVSVDGTPIAEGIKVIA
jgi:hypothetical protein